MLLRTSLVLSGAVGMASSATGCQAGRAKAPAIDVATPPLSRTFSSTGGSEQRGLESTHAWWTAFGDPQLDALVATALANHPSVGAARQRMLRAAALARRANAARRLSADGRARGGAGADRNETDAAFGLSASASYEVDLWGRLRAVRDANAWEAHATAADVDTVRLSLAAAVVNTWFALIAEARTGALLAAQYESNQQRHALLRTRFEQGKSAASDVLRQEQLAEATRGDEILSASRHAVLEHQLAALLGRSPPTTLPERPKVLPVVPPLPVTGVPGDVLVRRPDVAAAWRRIQASSSALAASLADRHPRLVLSLDGALAGAGLVSLFESWVLTLASELSGPLLDGGERAAQIAADHARRRELVHAYGETLLEAVRDVEDALVQERQAAAYRESLEVQLALADQVVDTLTNRYGQGATAYLDVLDALTAAQRLARDVVEAERQILEQRVALGRALAGTWLETCGPARATQGAGS